MPGLGGSLATSVYPTVLPKPRQSSWSTPQGGRTGINCRAIVPGVLAGRADRSELTRNWLQEGGFMTLRIMLVGLVASMGYDLPSGPDLSCWAQAGRDWVHARMTDLTGSVVEADCPDLGPTDSCQAEAPVAIKPSAVVEEVKRPLTTRRSSPSPKRWPPTSRPTRWRRKRSGRRARTPRRSLRSRRARRPSASRAARSRSTRSRPIVEPKRS